MENNNFRKFFDILSLIIPTSVSLLIFAISDLDKLELWKQILYGVLSLIIIAIPIVYYLIQRRLIKKQADQKKYLEEQAETIRLLEEQQENNKKLRYFVKFKEVISSISLFVNGYNQKKEEGFVDNLQALLNRMSLIYRDLKGVDCNFSVKVFKTVNSIETIQRTNHGDDRVNRESFVDEYSNFNEFLGDNSDLYDIYSEFISNKSTKSSKKGKYLKFVSNNLIDESGYRHSILLVEKYYENLKKMKEKGATKEDLERQKEFLWPLPFKSTIVVPLCMMEDKISDKDFAIAGTLCIDCKEKDVFNKEVDLSIMQSIAQTIYMTIRSIEKRKLTQETK